MKFHIYVELSSIESDETFEGRSKPKVSTDSYAKSEVTTLDLRLRVLAPTPLDNQVRDFSPEYLLTPRQFAFNVVDPEFGQSRKSDTSVH
jgi:hypothetical protein